MQLKSVVDGLDEPNQSTKRDTRGEELYPKLKPATVLRAATSVRIHGLMPTTT